MPPGTTSYEPTGPVDSPEPGQILVALCGAYPGDPAIQVLPNVRLLTDSWHEGARPHVGRYRYVFDDVLLDPRLGFPTRFEQVWPLSSAGPWVVQPDDHIVAFKSLPDGSFLVLADGFATQPKVDTGGDEEIVTFECLGVPVRAWDHPLYYCMMRDGDDLAAVPAPGDTDPDHHLDIDTELPIRFNPDGRPNATPADADHVEPAPEGTDLPELTFPVFVDPLIVRDPDLRRHWTLGMAVRHILGRGNPDQTDVINPDLDSLEEILVTFNPDGTTSPILCPDIDITGYCWPEAIAKLIEPHGFGLRFTMDHDGSLASALHRLDIYRKDDFSHLKVGWLQRADPDPDATLDLGLTNMPNLQLERDGASIANAWSVITAPQRLEISVVLAPNFEPLAEDADDTPDDDEVTAKAKFSSTDPRFHEDGNDVKYREWHAGEAGDPWWDLVTGAFHTEPLDLTGCLFPGEEPDPKVRPYVHRRRPPIRELLTADADGDPLGAELWISTDYDPADPANQVPPCLWSRKDPAHWQRVHGGWELMPDRLGIRLTMTDPGSWNIGEVRDPKETDPYPAGLVDAIASMATPGDPADEFAENKRFYLRLTCVIEADYQTPNSAPQRAASPTSFTIVRHDEARDRFVNTVRDRSSQFGTGQRKVIRDDGANATAHAEAKRRTHEGAKIIGAVTIPYISGAYEPGDKLYGLVGRDVEFNSLVGGGNGEPPVYPTIVSRDRHYEDNLTTVLQISDTRAEPIDRPRYNRDDTKKHARRVLDPPGTASGG